MTRHRFLSLALPFLAAVSAVLGQGFEPRVFTNSVGGTLPYQFLQPDTAAAPVPAPLVLFLHGAGERGDDNSAQLKHGTALYLDRTNRAAFPCFVVAPQCPAEKQWASMPWNTLSGQQSVHPTDPMRSVVELVDALAGQYRIDRDRLYVTGLSMGGFGTWDLITRYPNRFAGAVPVCGGGDELAAARAAPVPVWAFHSEDDGVVDVCRTRNMIAVLRAAGAHPWYTESTGLGHDSWTTAYREPKFLPWLFAQRLGQNDPYVWKTRPPQPPDVARLPDTDHALAGVGPIRRYDWFRNLWRNRRQGWAANRERDRGAVVFLGDSITQGWGEDLGASFPGLQVANRGISGDTTRGVVIRLQEDVLSLNPRAVVLLIGTNDLEEKAEPETIAENLRLILAMLHAHNPRLPVLLCRVFPSSATKSRPADRIQRVNMLYERVVKQVSSVPAHQAEGWIALLDTWTVFANEHGDAKPEEFPDLLHPNETGYRKWAEVLKPELERLGLLAPR